MHEDNTYKKRCVAVLFPEMVKKHFYEVIENYQIVSEIRIRRNGPVQVVKENGDFYVSENGSFHQDVRSAIRLSESGFDELFRHICRHSVYAFEEELKNGYLTVEGGHRIGVVGQTVWEGRKMKSIKYLNALNIRIAHEIKGVADPILPHLISKGSLKSTLLVSPPGCGKTTLLRDLVRKISNGSRLISPKNVSLIDERSEIASCYLGKAQNDVGLHTDVMDACPKAMGIMLVLRAMSPQVIAVDELGGEEDYDALCQAFYLGCNILATIHGTDYERLANNPYMKKLLKKGCFERIVFLGKRNGGQQSIWICNEKGEILNS